jgi:hypothetical protein
VNIENPAAYRFIIDEDIYLLKQDKLNTPNIITGTILTGAPEPVIIPALTPPVPITLAEPGELITPETTAVSTPVTEFKYMGDHKKSFLILVHYAEHEFINDEHLTALTNILKRMELAIADVAILNMAKYGDNTFEQITGHFKPQKLLLMGSDALPKGIEPLTVNQPQSVNNCKLLYTLSFDEMMSSNENKKAFWEQMKSL